MGLRAVLASETDRGMEVLAGEIVSARVVALEAFVTAFEDLSIGRALDARANVVLFGDAATRGIDRTTTPSRERTARAGRRRRGGALGVVRRDRRQRGEGREARRRCRCASRSAVPSRSAPCARSAPTKARRPRRGRRRRALRVRAIPRCSRATATRLHLKVGKDGRIREIALEMLKVSPLESNGPYRRFKLDRKL